MKKLLLVCVMAACGGGGPVSSSKEFKDLTPSEATAECNYLADNYPTKTVTCTVDGQSETIHIGIDKSDCTSATTDDVPDTCTATVADFEDCLAAGYDLSDDQICNETAPPTACAAVDADSCQSDDTSNRKTMDSLIRVSASLAVAQ